MRISFVSNYINHHQMPFCEEMIKLCNEGDEFVFIQTEKIAEDRLKMGWGDDVPAYVKLAYINDDVNKECRQMILDSEVVIFGGCEDESYIQPRLEAGKLTFRYSERVYKEAQWKWISPRGLKKKYHDHTRHNDKPAYLLCAGAYVASDYGKFKAYKNKMYRWGYFPAVYEYDIDELMAGKGYEKEGKKVPYILWAGRFLDWKHPELAVEVARFLKDKNIEFHMDIIGNGQQEELVRQLYDKYELDGCVDLIDFMKPEEVREHMKKADILLFTSDRNEGWGAVANEAMNSGCVVIADHMIGAVPYLIEDGVNGCVYDDRSREELFRDVMDMITNPENRENIGRNAYWTMVNVWNPRNAAESLMDLINEKMNGKYFDLAKRMPTVFAPCMREYPKSEARIKDELFGFVPVKLPRKFE